MKQSLLMGTFATLAQKAISKEHVDNTRHIIEMCAKACGQPVVWQDDFRVGRKGNFGLVEYKRRSGFFCTNGQEWNPLADTEVGRSQCAVMFAELGIHVRWGVLGTSVECWRGTDYPYPSIIKAFADHPSKTAAWQAAACAVAAAIGEAM
jgi:hypothetical protein